MKQLLFIHGGESFSTPEEQREFLKSVEIPDPFEDWGGAKWKHTLPVKLGADWEFAYPRMPNAVSHDYSIGAHYLEWKLWFDKHIPFFRDDIVFIGHSLGANFLAKYLAENTLPVSINQLHLVAGCYGEGDFTIPDSFENVEKQCEHIFIYHSKDDPVVPYADAEKYKTALPSARLITFEDRGHFLGETFPELIENIKG